MNRRRVAALVAVSVTAAGTGLVVADRASAHERRLRAVLRGPSGTRVGTVTFTVGRTGMRVRAVLDRNRYVAAGAFHGFHVHANNDPANGAGCQADPAKPANTWFVSADGHLPAAGTTHGAHAGDMPSPLVPCVRQRPAGVSTPTGSTRPLLARHGGGPARQAGQLRQRADRDLRPRPVQAQRARGDRHLTGADRATPATGWPAASSRTADHAARGGPAAGLAARRCPQPRPRAGRTGRNTRLCRRSSAPVRVREEATARPAATRRPGRDARGGGGMAGDRLSPLDVAFLALEAVGGADAPRRGGRLAAGRPGQPDPAPRPARAARGGAAPAAPAVAA